MRPSRNGGFISDSKLSRVSDGSQSGTITLRVPTDKFDAAVAQIRELGKVQQINVSTQDVTAEYVDLEARIRNSQREEREITKLFDRGGKLADIITIESKLSEVRERIERLQGQMRMLRDQTDLSTLNVSIFEHGQAAVAEPGEYSVAYHLRSAFRGLLGILRSLLTMLIYVVVVGWVVWVPILLLVSVSARRRRARAARNTPAPPDGGV